MTTPSVTTGFHENRHHIQPEAHIARDRRVFDRHGHFRGVLAELHQKLRLAVRLRLDHLPSNLDNIRICSRDDDGRRDVSRQALVIYQLHRHRLAIVFAAQRYCRRINFQLRTGVSEAQSGYGDPGK
jgi:hypothetical protein